MILPNEKSFTVENLSTDESYKLAMSVLGLGLGILTEYPLISFTVKDEDVVFASEEVDVIILGPVVNLL